MFRFVITIFLVVKVEIWVIYSSYLRDGKSSCFDLQERNGILVFFILISQTVKPLTGWGNHTDHPSTAQCSAGNPGCWKSRVTTWHNPLTLRTPVMLGHTDNRNGWRNLFGSGSKCDIVLAQTWPLPVEESTRSPGWSFVLQDDQFDSHRSMI